MGDNLIGVAMTLAATAHKDQMYGDAMYFLHLKSVVRILREFGFNDDDMVAAGYLHDAIEDTPVTKDEIAEQTNERIAELVFAVTNASGKNRTERNVKTYPKIKATPGAVALKLADRIANVESCWATRDSKLFMYNREYSKFRWTLRDPSNASVAPMWDRLDKLMGWWEPPR